MLLKLAAAFALFWAIPLSFAIDDAAAPFVALALFLVAVVSLGIGNSPLRVVGFHKGMFWIRGFSDEFLAGLDARPHLDEGEALTSS